MASLFDIGKSGLTAYRQALTVTGQNIANIDTEGYKRRAAGMEEVTAGRIFSSLQEIVTSPADLAPRVVAMEQAKMMADKFNEVAMLVDETKAGLVSQLTQQTDAVNILSSELAAVNQQIAATGTARPNNALLDSRDAMIDRISEYVAVTVELSATGVAKLTLGESGNGPAIVNGDKSQKIGVDPQDRSIAFIVAPGAANLVTSQVVNG
ncbi:MAG: flagellar basal body protein, partial [Alphaproteobacteria bacterium]